MKKGRTVMNTNKRIAGIFIAVFFMMCTLFCAASVFAAGVVQKGISMIGISKSVEYQNDDRYNIDVFLQGDGTMSEVTLQLPNGSNIDLVKGSDNRFRAEIIFDSEDELCSFPGGAYIFKIKYIKGTSFTTTVVYEEPEGGNIPCIMQEPVLTIPIPDSSTVLTPVIFRWQLVSDPNVLQIDLEWDTDSGINGEGSILDPSTDEYGPIKLTTGADYELDIAFNRAYWGTNSDGIPYVIDADSEQKYYFHVSGTHLCTDKDKDRYSIEGGDCGAVDCNDNDKSIYPGASELCDGKDNDCDTNTADGSGESWYGSPTSCGVDVCGSTGQYTCSAGKKTDTCTPRLPFENIEQSCTDTLDNDCDGKTDLLDSDCYPNKLFIMKTGNGNGTVTSSPKGINCGTDCYSYAQATTVKLTVKADANYEFVKWTGCTVNAKKPTECTLLIDSAKNVTAEFKPKSYDLKVTLAGNGAGKVSSDRVGIECGNGSKLCSTKYEYNTPVVLTATPLPDDKHSAFDKWTGDCNSCKDSLTCAVAVSKAKNCTANFKAFELKVSPGVCTGAIVSDISGIDCGTDCKEKYAPITVVTLSYTEDPLHSVFKEWKGCDKGTDLKDPASCKVTMKAAANVSAVCTAYELKVKKTGAGAGGGIVKSDPSGIDCGQDCTEKYAPGQEVTLTATTDSTASFTGWSGISCGTTTTCVVTMDKAKTVTATFASYELKVAKSGTGAAGGLVTSSPSGIDCGKDCSEKYPPNTSVTLTATTDSATAFAGWSEESCINTTCVVTLDKAKSVTARFSNTSSITGYVKDINGKGMTGFTVTAYSDGVKVKSATTDSKGKYVLDVPVSVEETEYVLSAEKAGYGFIPSDQFILVSNVNVTSGEDFIGFIYVVKGTVVMDYWNANLEEYELKPVSGATVKLKKVTGENEYGELTYKVVATVTTGSNGTFSLSKVVSPYDEYEISVSYKKLTGFASIDVTATTDGIIDTGEIMIEDLTGENL
jgi:hypothetical protein